MKVFEVDGSFLSLALFKDVTNSKELLNLMQAGTLEPEVAFLNASLIPDVFPLLAVAHKTLLAKSRDSLTTRTLHSELVYNYSGSKHITESLKRCGISDSSTYVLAARFGASLDEMKAVEKLIGGKEIDLDQLATGANIAQIQKHYKISGPELGISSLADAITCRIAVCDALHMVHLLNVVSFSYSNWRKDSNLSFNNPFIVHRISSMRVVELTKKYQVLEPQESFPTPGSYSGSSVNPDMIKSLKLLSQIQYSQLRHGVLK